MDLLITRRRTRGASPMTVGGRAALARAAATRAAVASRPTARLGRAAAAAKYGDGNVDAYTRTQNGRSVYVRGYARP